MKNTSGVLMGNKHFEKGGEPDELKTLKDCKDLEEARDEAVKYVKFLIKKDNHDHTKNCKYCKEWMGEVNGIKHFCNITEEDLK